VLDKHVPFLEGTGVEQDVEALARCQLAALMLRLDAAGAAAGAGPSRFSSKRRRISLMSRSLS